MQRQLVSVDDFQSLCKVDRRMSLTRSTCAIAFHRVAEGLISPTYDGLDGRIRASIVWAKSLLSSIDSPYHRGNDARVFIAIASVNSTRRECRPLAN